MRIPDVKDQHFQKKFSLTLMTYRSQSATSMSKHCKTVKLVSGTF